MPEAKVPSAETLVTRMPLIVSTREVGSADAGSGLNCANQRSTFVLTAPPSFPKKKIANSAGSESPGAVGTRWVARRIAELLASTGQDAGDFQVRPPASTAARRRGGSL